MFTGTLHESLGFGVNQVFRDLLNQPSRLSRLLEISCVVEKVSRKRHRRILKYVLDEYRFL